MSNEIAFHYTWADVAFHALPIINTAVLGILAWWQYRYRRTTRRQLKEIDRKLNGKEPHTQTPSGS